MNTKINKSLIISLFLLIAAGVIIYFLDLPQYQTMQDNRAKIIEMENTLKNKASYNKLVAEASQKLDEVNWEVLKKKMDPIFTIDPFYASKMDVFFRDVTKRSGMNLSSLSFSSSASSPTTPEPTASEGTEIKITPIIETTTTAVTPPTIDAGTAISGVSNPIKANAVTIVATGSYDQFKNLLKILEKQAYLVSVKAVNFSGGTAITNFTINAEVYSY